MVKQAPKMTALVVSAIRNLREVQGSTPREILNYIMSEYNTSNSVTDSAIQRKLCTALKRGLEYGILKQVHGHYCLNTDPEAIVPTDDMMGPMERGGRGCKSAAKKKRRRRRGGAGGRKGCKSRSRRRGKRAGGGRKGRRRGKRGGGRSKCGGGRKKGRGRSRKGKKSRGGKRRGHRRGGRRGRKGKSAKCQQRRTGEDIDMLTKDPVDNRHRDHGIGGYNYDRERERSQSRGRQSRSRSRSPSHSRSSGSSDREANEGNRRDRQVD